MEGNNFDAALAQASFMPGDRIIANVGYILREPPPSLVDRPITEQANASVYYPINDTWSVFGAYEYSLEASEMVESMAGFEYDDCCWRVRLLYMRYVDTLVGDMVDFNDPNLERESSFQVQVMLKGMGGFGGRVDELLSDMIRGFTKSSKLMDYLELGTPGVIIRKVVAGNQGNSPHVTIRFKRLLRGLV